MIAQQSSGAPAAVAGPLAAQVARSSALSPTASTGSVIIPAHDEARVIGRLLSHITRATDARDLEIVVVCNGCTDDTAAVARQFAPVRVIEVETASKHAAIREGERHVAHYPRAYLDADVEIDAADLTLLMDVAEESGVLAVGPRRCLDLARSSWTVRAFYRVWSCLPAVQGLQGRGLIVVSRAGHERLRDWPALMADDLFVSTRFGPTERRVVDGASVTIHGPRTTRDLIRRRIRAAQGNAELVAWDPALRSTGGQSVSSLFRQFSTRPAGWLDVLAFLAVTCVARISSRLHRRSLGGVWLRDDSSRA